jgi:hypothetical protein
LNFNCNFYLFLNDNKDVINCFLSGEKSTLIKVGVYIRFRFPIFGLNRESDPGCPIPGFLEPGPDPGTQGNWNRLPGGYSVNLG